MSFDMIPNSKTFILTIQRNKSRFDATMAHLKSHGVEPTVFCGLDGDICGLETRWGIDFFDTNHDTKRDTYGWVAMFVSYLMLFKVCLYQPEDVFVFLEDDVRLTDDWKTHIDSAVRNLPSDWDMVFIGSCCTSGRPIIAVKDRLHQISYANCTHAFAVRSKAIPILIEHLQKIHAKVDIQIALDVMPHLQCFAILPTIAIQEGTKLPP